MRLTSVSATILDPFGGAAAPTEHGGDGVLEALQAWWAATPGVRATTSDGKLWHRTAPEGTPTPYATAFLVAEPADAQTTGYRLWRSAVQVNLHAATDAAARSMGRAVRGLLDRAPLAIGGVRALHVLADSSAVEMADDPGPAGEDVWIDMETFEVLWAG